MKHDTEAPGLRELADLLERQRRRIRTRFALHGAGWMVAASCAAVAVYFALDRYLELPAAVRIVLTLAVLVWLTIALRRRVLYPLHRSFGTDDVAIAIERRFPDLRQQLISAWQLGRGHRREESAAMVRAVVAEAAERIRALPVDSVLDPRRTARVWTVACAAGVVAITAFALHPLAFGVFLKRALGFSVDYPRLTHLAIELPESSPDHRIEHAGDRAIVTLAAGGDLPVLVRADGVVPREVFLVVDGGGGMPAEVPMARRQEERFRHTFRRVREPFTFHARGGDDPHGDLVVEVRTVRPPLVGTITADLRYPGYTGKEPETLTTGSIEALVGTEVRLHVNATAPVDDARIVFLESGRELPLEAVSIEDDEATRMQFAGEFVITSSDRYRIELESPEGLRNPNPGEYPIIALVDHAPVGRILVPAGDDLHVALPGALVPVRIDARDDFGVRRIGLALSSSRGGEPHARELLPADGDPGRETIVSDIVPLSVLEVEGQGPSPGETLVLEVTVADNRAPEALVAELQRRQIHVVDAADFARRIAGHFRRVREAVESGLELQVQRRELLEGLVENLSEIAAAPRRNPDLVLIEVGQGRIATAARRVHEDFMRAFDAHLFNGLEESIHAPKVVELWLDYHRAHPEREAWLPGFYRAVAEARRSGAIGAMETTLDPMLEMTERGDRLARVAAEAVEGMQQARLATNEADLHSRLDAVLRLQQEIETELRELLGRLDRWNEYQDVIQQARALRDAQRDVVERTRSIMGGERR